MRNFLLKFNNENKLNTIQGRLLGSFLWNSLGVVSSRGSLLIANILIARMLGIADYGELTIIITTILSVGVFVDLGLSMTGTKFISQYRIADPAKIGNLLFFLGLTVFCTGLGVGAGLFFNAPLVAEYLGAPHITELIKIVSFLPIFMASSSLGLGLLAGLEQFKSLSFINILMGISNLLGMSLGAYLSGISGVLWASLILAVLNVVLITYAVKRSLAGYSVAVVPASIVRDFKKFMNFTLPALMIGLTYGPAVWFCNALLVKGDNGFVDVAIVGASMQWFAIAIFLPASLSSVVLPVSSNLATSTTNEAYRSMVIRSGVFAALLSLPIVVVISLLSPFILGFYGEDFVHGWPVLVVTMITGLFVSIQINIGNSLSAKGIVWSQLVFNILQALIFVGLTMLWISHGAYGFVLAKGISYVFLLMSSVGCILYATSNKLAYAVYSNN